MTEEQYNKAQQLKDESGYLVWEINLLEQAAKGGFIKVCLSREDNKYGVTIEGNKAADVIGAWIAERKARVAEIETEFNAL